MTRDYICSTPHHTRTVVAAGWSQCWQSESRTSVHWIETYLFKPGDWAELTTLQKRDWDRKRIANANRGINPFLGKAYPGMLRPWGVEAKNDLDYLPLDIVREMAEKD